MENVLGSELWEAHALGPVTEGGLLSPFLSFASKPASLSLLILLTLGP